MSHEQNNTPDPRYGATNPEPGKGKSKRYGSVIGLNPHKEQYYRELHADCWPQVIKRLQLSHIHNYSIFITELNGMKLLFSYFEYSGDSFDQDMQAIAADPMTQKWWEETDPCQFTLIEQTGPRPAWMPMEALFYMP